VADSSSLAGEGFGTPSALLVLPSVCVIKTRVPAAADYGVSFPCPQNARSRQPRISMRRSGRVRIVLEGPDQGAKGIDTRNGEPNHATQSLSHVRGRHVYRTREKEAIPENRGQNSSVSTLQVPENLSHHPKVGDFSPNATE